MPRDRFAVTVGVEIEGQGAVGIECVWNGSGWVPDLGEFRRYLTRAARELANDEDYSEEE